VITATWRTPHRYPESSGPGAASDSIPAVLAASLARAEPGRPLLLDGDTELDGPALAAAVAARQADLRAVGVVRGDVVLAQLPNWWETVVLAHAVWGMGGVLCPVPVNYRTRELVSIVTAVPVAAAVVPRRYHGVDHVAMLGEATATVGVAPPVLVVRDDPSASAWESAQAGGSGAPELAAGLDDVCLLMFTSGTTGRPKGVLHSARTLLAESRSIVRLFALSGDRVYMPSPIAHITGLLYGVLLPVLVDGSCVLQAEWDAAAGADLVERHGCTFCVGATPFLRGLTDEYVRRGTRSRLQAFVCGGADIPSTVVERATAVLGATVTRAYGLTEMPTVSCGGPQDPPAVRVLADGRLTGSSRARLAEAVDGVGQLEAHGPELCLGYLDQHDTDDAFTDDGWFRTGDLASLGDEGSVTIRGRAKDIVVRGGENISVREVEDLLLEHPGVTDVAIVGVPDDRLGERACAFVVGASSTPVPTLGELGEFLAAQQIAKHKLPEFLLVVPSLPRTPSGKVQKFLLRDRALAELASGHGQRR
jgi:cyclohexanecarboxylate-CoA ligase